jgi:hypothetical protein
MVFVGLPHQQESWEARLYLAKAKIRRGPSLINYEDFFEFGIVALR